LPAERRVLDFGELSRAARRGWAGEKVGLFEHPAWRFLLLSRTYRPAEFWQAHKVFCNLQAADPAFFFEWHLLGLLGGSCDSEIVDKADRAEAHCAEEGGA